MSQETQEVLELESFNKITKEDKLRKFEEDNRGRIIAAPIHVKMAFDEKWSQVTGTSYFIPVTRYHAPTAVSDASLCPRDTLYRVKRRIVSLKWEKFTDQRRHKSGIVKVYERYHLKAVLPDGSETTVEYRLDKELLEGRLGKELADKLVFASLKATSGVITGLDAEIPVIGYWEVLFSPKGDPTQPNDVGISWEGVCLQIERAKRVVVPGYYLEVCDNGVYPKYIQTPQQSRKIVSWVQFYPYTVTREATEQEFLDTKARGDLLQREARRREEVAA